MVKLVEFTVLIMPDPLRILYIDDDLELSELVEEYLQGKDISVRLLHNPDHVLPELQNQTYDLCLMDVKMPGKDGFMLAEELTENNVITPFLFLTGQTRKEDRIKGLRLGAQDYISKPFSLEELYLRILNIARRTDQQQAKPISQFKLGDYVFKADYGELIHQGTTENLSTTESKLLRLFCDRMNELVLREEILVTIWGENDYYKGLSLNVYITRLRKRFETTEDISIINEHGKGYRFVVR